MNNHKLIAEFYSAFAKYDAEAMVSHYHKDITFEDPVFGILKGDDTKNMWRMLIKRGNGKLQITYSNLRVGDNKGSADWKAIYPFGKSGRIVTNIIHAEFEFKDGLIIKHKDTFNLWKWTRQAIGYKGLLLGWTGFMKKKIQIQSIELLKIFSQNN